ncbi:15449_t:CDS:2 [Acaulospora morrowiae]|uniref:15449_t:CDS:1 n=1 Tax=Acaulospora morrowiae TaxID=94023 RepID=A0A9N8VAF5_9GLOM|nr:15449_t:CDS:2 [Acaulospora morrowiae]
MLDLPRLRLLVISMKSSERTSRENSTCPNSNFKNTIVTVTDTRSFMPTTMSDAFKISKNSFGVRSCTPFVKNIGYIPHNLKNPTIFDYNFKVSIPGWTIVDAMLGFDRHASYQIVCRYWLNGREVNKLIVNKRYTDFYWFHQGLVRKHGDSIVPKLTPKQWQGRFEPKFIEKRRINLEYYLRSLVMSHREELISFLDGCRKGTKVITDGGPQFKSECLRNVKVKDNPPIRSCLAVGTTRCRINNRVHFADWVLNNEKASRNPNTREHVSQNENIKYHM